MRLSNALSIGLSALVLVLGMTTALPTADAASATLMIDQKSPIAEYGYWTVRMPNDATYKSSLKTKILSDIAVGNYEVHVNNPAGSITKMSLIRSGTVIQEEAGNTMAFSITDDQSYRINIEFAYTGTIKVLSNPANVGFEMTNVVSGRTYTGVTPAEFGGMAPEGYKIRYDIEPACEIPKTLQRELVYGTALTFYRDFTCGDRPIPTAGRTTKPLATEPVEQEPAHASIHTDSPDKHIIQTSSMSEVVPGGLIRFTITVRNVSRETLHNVTVTDRYNPEMLTVSQPLFDGGVVDGNMVVWNVPKIFAGQRWSTTFTARADDSLTPGDRIVLMAHATSDESDMGVYPEAWSAVTGVGVAYLPQTGDAYDILLAIVAMIGAALITNITIRRKTLVEQTA